MTETKSWDAGVAASRSPLPALWWDEAANRLSLVDQTRLPGELVILHPSTADEIAEAIRTLKVRGAPAIGIAAAYGLAFGAREALKDVSDPDEAMTHLRAVADTLRATRPTAVNLGWELDHMLRRVEWMLAGKPWPTGHKSLADLPDELIHLAILAGCRDRDACEAMGLLGAQFIKDGGAVLTHCNAGALATGGIGTALAPIFTAYAYGASVHVYVDETRPVLQGARLTAWELMRVGIPATLITDSMAASIMRREQIKAVFVGADRIAANGDVANKIGTYGLAIIAREHGVPFYVVAPTSTVDLATPDGDSIPIEERAASEVTTLGGVRIAPEGIAVANPAFDVTPARYVTAIITNGGVAQAPYAQSLAALPQRLPVTSIRPGDGPLRIYSEVIEEIEE